MYACVLFSFPGAQKINHEPSRAKFIVTSLGSESLPAPPEPFTSKDLDDLRSDTGIQNIFAIYNYLSFY